MINHDQMRQLNSLLENAQTILIMYGTDPSNDELAAAASLLDAFKKTGKQASLYSPSQPKSADDMNLVDQTKTEVGRQNLVVSFDYSEDAVDKVSYHIGEESNRFFLTIKPKQGQEPLDTESVEFSYTGADADLIFLVGVRKLGNLEQLYYGYESLYRDTPVVTLSSYPAEFSTLNLGADTPSLSEAAASVLKEMQLSISPDTATNLLSGIEETTNNLQAMDVTADTFEIVAHLMRSGAVRRPVKSEPKQPQVQREKSARTEQEFEVRQDKSKSTENKQRNRQQKKNHREDKSSKHQPGISRK